MAASGEGAAASGPSDASDNGEDHPDINHGGRKARNPMSAISGAEFERKVNAASLRYLRELVQLLARARKADLGKDTQLSMSTMVVTKYHRDGAMRVSDVHEMCIPTRLHDMANEKDGDLFKLWQMFLGRTCNDRLGVLYEGLHENFDAAACLEGLVPGAGGACTSMSADVPQAESEEELDARMEKFRSRDVS